MVSSWIFLSIIAILLLFYIIDTSITIQYLNTSDKNEKSRAKNWNIMMLTLSCIMLVSILGLGIYSIMKKTSPENLAQQGANVVDDMVRAAKNKLNFTNDVSSINSD